MLNGSAGLGGWGGNEWSAPFKGIFLESPQMVGRRASPKMSTPKSSRTCGYVTMYAQRDFPDVSKFMDLTMARLS